MKKFHLLACLALVAAMTTSASAAKRAPQPGVTLKTSTADQHKLIELLRSNAAPAAKALACKQLALVGDAEAVPALAPLLGSSELAAWSRIALEVIPDTAADDALRGAMGQLQGRLLVGVINSLGVRRDTKAVDSLIARLKDPDADVASAAAVALGHIGTAPSIQALQTAVAAGPKQVRSAAAEGCILCAEAALAQHDAAQAIKLYDLVRGSDLPKTRIVEATRGAILARGSEGIPLLLEQLHSADKASYNLGLRVARELPGREVTDAVAAELPKAAGQRRGMLVMALADRGEARVLPIVLQAAGNGDEEVQILAIRALKRVGDASCAAALLDVVASGSEEVSKAALDVVGGLQGNGVDEQVVKRLAAAPDSSRATLLQLTGRRHIASALPLLWKAADDKNEAVRLAATTALGETADSAELPKLIARLVAAKSETEAASIQRAVAAVCLRTTDRETCTQRVAAALSSAKTSAEKDRILDILATVGGSKALEAVARAAKSSDAELCDSAYRVLGKWNTIDAAPVLLELHKATTVEKYKSRAIRAYIRMARQFTTIPEPQRAEMCRTAMAIAQHDEDKRLILEVCLRYPSNEMLALATEAMKVPGLKDEANVVVLSIARGKVGDATELRKALAQAGHNPVKLEIVKALFGAGANTKDVTTTLRRHAKNYRVIFLPSDNYNEAFGGDPAPGEVKKLTINYRVNGKSGEVSLSENATVVLPLPR